MILETSGDKRALAYAEHEEDIPGTDMQPLGRLTAFHGQMGMFVRALTYMLSHGADGLKQVAEDAVLNANYIQARMKHVMTPAFDGFCMHEALFSDKFTADGIETIDIAKSLIDEGYHPMTMYFPLVVHGAMLIEPTETESKAELDRFCDALEGIAKKAAIGDASMKSAPYLAPMKRLDETQAARKPILKWVSSSTVQAAAE
jgi:glycine dehydrogenase subunit 2